MHFSLSKSLLFFLAASVFCICLVLYKRKPSVYIEDEPPPKEFMILAATTYFQQPITNSQLNKFSKEVQESCGITNNWDLFDNASAVLFHSRDINEKVLSQLKHPRRLDIPYIMMTMESPYNAELYEYKNYFNWTMTYRRDSDVFHPYGLLVKNNKQAKINYTKIWNTKTKDSLWLNSNKKSSNSRTELVEKLVKMGMKIDLMGYSYESKVCTKPPGIDECNYKLQSPYKFYISFENGNCKDYVTEKFWDKANYYHMVPIVMSRKIYRNLGIPDSMYISVDDFPSLNDFVAYIKKVSNNKTEYLKYHRWRENYRIVNPNEGTIGYCQLCQKLMNSNIKIENCMQTWLTGMTHFLVIIHLMENFYEVFFE